MKGSTRFNARDARAWHETGHAVARIALGGSYGPDPTILHDAGHFIHSWDINCGDEVSARLERLACQRQMIKRFAGLAAEDAYRWRMASDAVGVLVMDHGDRDLAQVLDVDLDAMYQSAVVQNQADALQVVRYVDVLGRSVSEGDQWNRAADLGQIFAEAYAIFPRATFNLLEQAGRSRRG
jgi:hypothetical protein